MADRISGRGFFCQRMAAAMASNAAANCGVALLATIHAADVEELKRKLLFAQLLKLKVFERAVTITRHGAERRYQVAVL